MISWIDSLFPLPLGDVFSLLIGLFYCYVNGFFYISNDMEDRREIYFWRVCYHTVMVLCVTSRWYNIVFWVIIWKVKVWRIDWVYVLVFVLLDYSIIIVLMWEFFIIAVMYDRMMKKVRKLNKYDPMHIQLFLPVLVNKWPVKIEYD